MSPIHSSTLLSFCAGNLSLQSGDAMTVIFLWVSCSYNPTLKMTNYPSESQQNILTVKCSTIWTAQRGYFTPNVSKVSFFFSYTVHIVLDMARNVLTGV